MALDVDLIVRKSVLVEASPEHAFDVFTAGFSTWWPLDTHHIGEADCVEAVIEPRAGGRWYERGEDGSECDWGHVLAWEPPRRLVLAWQLDAQWDFNPALVTEVEVRFDAEPGGGTKVTLEHRCLERYGAGAEAARSGLASEGGWSGLLERYRQMAS